MTCVIGYVDTKGNSHIVADSAGTDVTYHNRSDLNETKIFQKGDMLIGYTTSFRMGQILEHCVAFPERSEGLSDFEYLVKELVPTIRKAFVDEKYISDSDKYGGVFIIVWNGKVYEIQSDFAVLSHSRRFASCGSGYTQAQGYMAACLRHGILTDSNVEKVMRSAIEAIANFNITVSGRVDYLKVPAKRKLKACNT